MNIAEHNDDFWNSLETEKTQQKQEPVGRFSKFTDGVWKEVTSTSSGQFLYAAPPQRQPLTDEEIWDAYMEIAAEFDCNVIDLVEFARAIEAAHGIKGEA